MLLKKFFVMFIILSLFIFVTNQPIKPAVAFNGVAKPTLGTAQKALQSQSGFFTENKGQWDSSILFVGDTSFGKVAFAKDAIYYQMIKVTEQETKNDSVLSMENKSNRFDQKEKEKEYQSQVVKLSFAVSFSPSIHGADVFTHNNNYLICNKVNFSISNDTQGFGK